MTRHLGALFAVFLQSLHLRLEKSILTPIWNVPPEIRSILHEFVYCAWIALMCWKSEGRKLRMLRND